MDAKDKGDTAFRLIAASMEGTHFERDPKEILLDYARAQARRDPRLAGARVRFGNFSLIVTFGPVEAQAEHIDLLRPGFQFGLMVTDNCPGTSFSTTPPRISTVEDLAREWARKPGVSDELFELLREDPVAGGLIRDFGDVLHMAQKELKHVPNLRRGSLCSLPGGVKHAGPAWSDFRAVMFFSAHPEDTEEERDYHPDEQYTASTLCAHLVCLLWQKATEDHRRFLLQTLAGYMDVEKQYNKAIWVHFAEGEFADCARQLQTLRGSKREGYIQESTKNDNTCRFCNPFPMPAQLQEEAVGPSPASSTQACRENGQDSSASGEGRMVGAEMEEEIAMPSRKRKDLAEGAEGRARGGGVFTIGIAEGSAAFCERKNGLQGEPHAANGANGGVFRIKRLRKETRRSADTQLKDLIEKAHGEDAGAQSKFFEYRSHKRAEKMDARASYNEEGQVCDESGGRFQTLAQWGKAIQKRRVSVKPVIYYQGRSLRQYDEEAAAAVPTPAASGSLSRAFQEPFESRS